MKLTKSKLKQLIKEEIDAVIDQEQGMESSAQPRGPQVDLDKLVASVQTCIAQGGLTVAIRCSPIALELATAVLDEDWIAAFKATQSLMKCVPVSCRDTVQELLKVLQPLTLKD